MTYQDGGSGKINLIEKAGEQFEEKISLIGGTGGKWTRENLKKT